MALITRRLVAFDDEAAVIEATVDDTDIDPSIPLDAEEPDPLIQARVTQVTATNNSSRPVRIQASNIKATLAPNSSRTFSIPRNRRVALGVLVQILGN